MRASPIRGGHGKPAFGLRSGAALRMSWLSEGEGGEEGAQSTGRPTQLRATHRWMLPEPVRLPTLSAARALCHGEHLLCLHHDRLHRHTSRESAPSQACNAKTDLSDFLKLAQRVGNGWGKALAHPVYQFHGQISKILLRSAPKRAFSQPLEKKASKDTTQRPPRPCATSPPPRARPSGGRSTAIPPQHGRTRAGSKLPAGPQRGAAHHRQPQKGAERACDLPTAKIQVAFLSSDREFG